MKGVTVVDSVRDLPASRWDDLAAGTGYNGHGWHLYQEQAPGVQSRCVLVSEGTRWVAAAELFVVASETNPLYRPPGYTDAAVRPIVLAGNRRGYANRLLATPEHVGDLVDAAHAVADEWGHGEIWWMFVDHASAAALLPWSAAPAPWLLDGDCSIDLPGTEFSDYLAAATPGVRKRVRRDRLLYERAGYRTEERPLAECWREVARLVAALERHHGRDVDVEATAGLLCQQSRAMGDAARVDACYVEGVMVGANLRFDVAGTTVSRACGFDYERLRDACEYFELAYYRPIEAAYSHGNRSLGLGIGTYETKIRRGAQVDLRYAVVTGSSGRRATARTYNRDRLAEMIGTGLRETAIRDLPEPDWIEV